MFIAPALFNLRNFGTVSSVALLLIPSKSLCVEALPSGGKKSDSDDNFFKKFTDKIPAHVKSDLSEILGAGAGSLKSAIESGVPGQVRSCTQSAPSSTLLTGLSHHCLIDRIWVYDGLL